jgi:hypothetical protein
MRFIDEVVHRLSRAAVEPPVEQEPAVAGNLLAVVVKLIALLKESFETVLRRRSTALALHPLRDDSLAAGAFWSATWIRHSLPAP